MNISLMDDDIIWSSLMMFLLILEAFHACDSGANDVSMIQMADVGVGISGRRVSKL